ncbi:hypothetical protein FB451DRAFT_1491990 [Mycena latifolia]|nr:hypothetical protein FB451DRAFT_1491990 [Mycena latifolia]
MPAAVSLVPTIDSTALPSTPAAYRRSRANAAREPHALARAQHGRAHGDSASDTAIPPPSLSAAPSLAYDLQFPSVELNSPARPPLGTHSSSFHSHAFGAAGSASSSIYAPNDSDAGYHFKQLRPGGPPGLPAGVPFTPIPPVSPPEVVAYFPIARAMDEAAASPTTSASEVQLPPHPPTDEAAQRAGFSGARYGVLGREGAGFVEASADAAEATELAAAQGDVAIFTVYGLHIPGGHTAATPAGEGARAREGRAHEGPHEREPEDEDGGESLEDGNGKAKGRPPLAPCREDQEDARLRAVRIQIE